MLLSIIIPVYNAEKFIERCIRSILIQCKNLNDVEIIVIDDGSSDGSYQIIKRLADDNEIIKLYSQENQGEGFTRNVGLEKANGKYACFVDADDFLDGAIIKKIHDSLINAPNDIDIIMYGMKRVTENGKTLSTVQFKDELTTVKKLLSQGIYSNSVCNKVFKLKNIEDHGIKFNTVVKTATDFDFSFRMLYFSEKVKTISGLNYNYIVNPDSVSNIRTSSHLDRLAKHSVIVANDLKHFLLLNQSKKNSISTFKPWLDNYLYGLFLSLFRFNYATNIIKEVIVALKKHNNYPISTSRMPLKKKIFVKLANHKNIFLGICGIKKFMKL